MVAELATARRLQIRPHGIHCPLLGHFQCPVRQWAGDWDNHREGALRAPRFVSWLATQHWPTQYPQSFGASGHPSRLRAGSNAFFPKETHKQVSHALPRSHTCKHVLPRNGQGIARQCPDRETIYRSLYIQARGVLKKELLEHLRAKRTVRRSKHASLKRNSLGQIKDARIDQQKACICR